ncbi:hypothetical protein C0995_014111 [Termitomyces sp. Mi166|nr:hypothetical protein C0995_014111 [Termitomyces sp. Mi166\
MARQSLNLLCAATIFTLISAQLIPAILDFYATRFCLSTLSAETPQNHRRSILGDLICRGSTASFYYDSSLDRISMLREVARKDYVVAAASTDTCAIIQSVQDNGPPFSCDVREYGKEAQDHLQAMVSKAEVKCQSRSEVLALWDHHRNAAVESAQQFSSSPEQHYQLREGIFKLGVLLILMCVFLWQGIRSTPTTPAQLQLPPQQASGKATRTSTPQIKVEDSDDDEVQLLPRSPMARLLEAPVAPPTRAQSLPASRCLFV